jgi:uncharacterized protein (TIGR00251 family)
MSLAMGRTREGAVFRLRVQPHARRQEVAGVRQEALVVKVTAPPEGGRANEACRRLLADILDLPAQRVEIIRGHTARDKVVLVHGLTPDEVADRLKECLGK